MKGVAGVMNVAVKRQGRLKRALCFFVSAVITTTALAISAFALSDSDKQSFDSNIYSMLLNYPSSINVTAYSDAGWTTNEIMEQYLKTIYNHPDLFYINYNIRIKWRYSGNTLLYSHLTDIDYNYPQSAVASKKAELEEVASDALSGLNDGMTNTEKALYLHDYIASHTTYDKTLTKRNAYACLVEGSAVCQGYCAAYKYLLDKCGIENVVIKSESMQHCWNYIKLDGNWYHVDLTWDDSASNKNIENFSYVSHRYFLLSDKAMLKNGHKGWNTDGKPAALSEVYDSAFWHGVKSKMQYLNGEWYYILGNKNKSTLKKFSFAENKLTTICSIDALWGGTNNFTTLTYCENKLFFNSAKKIYSFDLAANKLTEVFTYGKKERYVYGVGEKEGKLMFVSGTSFYMKDIIVHSFA